MPYMFRLPKNHVEIFGNNEAVSIPYMMRTMFGLWDKVSDVFSLNYDTQRKKIHKQIHLCFTDAYEHFLDEDERKKFWDEYVEHAALSRFDHFMQEKNISRNQKFWDWVEEGVTLPLLVCQIVNRYGVTLLHVLEGNHRAGVANALGLESLPIFRIIFVEGAGDSSITREEFYRLKDLRDRGEL